ncbi:phasin family protein [Synechocystis salina LEGE 06099]|uniref:phasin family protein n=1 Tax=Synechocystis salina TaxID=945780 RepID=UPI0018830108|nr:phasin family protein [Synechocystis salina]MBE9204161.1 phasin family protein [Synechocystis salina LEGE 06099]
MKTTLFSVKIIMLRDLVQKAVYLGVGIASYAAETANSNIKELGNHAQKLVDTLVERGEMNAEEARRYVDDLIREAQGEAIAHGEGENKQPRRIEIITDEEEANADPLAQKTSTQTQTEDVEALRRQVAALQAELQRLNRQP